jgi:predicted nucleic acid-binding protein
MFVLDTNILSAMMLLHPPREVMGWVDQQDEDLLFTTVITQAEILSGLAIMTVGRRRDLETAAAEMFSNEFQGRVLSFDMMASADYADIFVIHRRAGRATEPMDLMIAAIARSRGRAW